MRIIGLMSGTSADGIDACLAHIDERDGRLIVRTEHFVTVPYPDDVRGRVLGCRSVEDVCRLNIELGERFADAALKLCEDANVPLAQVDAIGSHGQTVCHVDRDGSHATLQVGEPCVIAERTGLTTVADFRPRDIAAGGCGAPLVPMVDYLLLADPAVDRAALNIGGIANLTILTAGGALDDVVAFDTGPGNMVIDGVVSALTGGRAAFDPEGELAGRGTPCEALLDRLVGDPYFAAPPPKSTGREAFGADYVERFLGWARPIGLSEADTVATATALTVRTIADAVRQIGDAGGELIVSGGGAHNRTLMAWLAEELPEARIETSEVCGIHPDAKEALAFAVLAWLTLHGRPGNVPGATGARVPVVLGKIAPGRTPPGET